MTLEEALNLIEEPNDQAMKESKMRWDSIAKPLNSLGRLEAAVIKIAGIFGTNNINIDKKALVIMCADNGVVNEGVTQTGMEVTKIVAQNFLKNKASVSIMAKYAGVDLYPVDIGIASDTDIINKKICYGTKNMIKEPAMTIEEAKRAIITGIELVGELAGKGYKIIATGEMGIGNTTTSSAVIASLFDTDAVNVTGKGAGLTDKGLNRKIEVINEAIKINKPDKNDPIDILSKVGGLDIAGLVGMFLGGAVYRVPIVIDGFISAVAALLAVRLNSSTVHYMIASHASKEPAARLVLDELCLEEFINCEMCLGEGTGAVALLPILDMAFAVYNEMSTFEQIDVEAYKQL